MKKHVEMLVQEMRKLPSQNHRLAFAVAVAEGLLPFYLKCSHFAWCDTSVALGVIDRLWKQVETGDKIGIEEFQKLYDCITEASPDLEKCAEFNALDTCSALSFALRPAAHPEDKRFPGSVAEVALQNVGSNLGILASTPAFWKSAEVQAETARQSNILAFLTQNLTLGNEAIVTLRRIAAQGS